MSTTDDQSDRENIRLLPGQVGLQGDRATFHLGQGASQLIPLAKDGRPTGTVFYNMQPVAAPIGVAGRSDSKNQQPQRKHVMQVLPGLPLSSTDASVGPVTGMPIGNDEHVFLLRLGKQYEDPDEKTRLQIEVRLPKNSSPSQTETHTQCLPTDLLTLAVEKNRKHGKNKAGGKKSTVKKSAAVGSKKKEKK